MIAEIHPCNLPAMFVKITQCAYSVIDCMVFSEPMAKPRGPPKTPPKINLAPEVDMSHLV